MARGKAAKGRFVSVYIFIFGFTKVQLTELLKLIFAKRPPFGLLDVNIIAWELGNR